MQAFPQCSLMTLMVRVTTFHTGEFADQAAKDEGVEPTEGSSRRVSYYITRAQH